MHTKKVVNDCQITISHWEKNWISAPLNSLGFFTYCLVGAQGLPAKYSLSKDLIFVTRAGNLS
jgi:hypothetical protein